MLAVENRPGSWILEYGSEACARARTGARGGRTSPGSPRGRIGPAEGPDDGVQISLFGTVFGLMALAAVAVLFATSEYKRHLAWTTFSASPRRSPSHLS